MVVLYMRFIWVKQQNLITRYPCLKGRSLMLEKCWKSYSEELSKHALKDFYINNNFPPNKCLIGYSEHEMWIRQYEPQMTFKKLFFVSRIDRPKSYYENIMSKLNGVLFPGGATWFNQTNGYSEAGRYIYDIAVEMNDRGEHMPIFGTCLGFELLTYLSANGTEHREDCYSDRQALPLEFEEGVYCLTYCVWMIAKIAFEYLDFRNSRLFGSCPDDIVEILASQPVTANFHQFCVTKEVSTLKPLKYVQSKRCNLICHYRI